MALFNDAYVSLDLNKISVDLDAYTFWYVPAELQQVFQFCIKY